MRACVGSIIFVPTLVALASGRDLPLPNLLGASQVAVPLALIAPIVVAITISSALVAGSRELEVVTSRRLKLLDACLVVTTTGLTLAACAVAYLVMQPDTVALRAGRDTLGYVGLALIGRGVVGAEASAVLPSSYLLLSSLIRPATPLWAGLWGWGFAPADNALSWFTVFGLLALGIAFETSQRNMSSAN